MDEARKPAVTLRRSRATRSAPPPPTWHDTITSRVAVLATPPRQVWLAALGGTALTVRAGHAVWQRLVAEGEAVEQWLRTPRRLAASLGLAPRKTRE